ncbi:MAG: hypothetical protein OMM_06786 [Candidatus Magnetoglobus multicellularis str. Araruama]|uniref:Uncharacterized protein n=1 Tax=Candidatus Magnetoglobus multicellularis str. Araruama TaxID=890399 RepID=A0A1V1PFY9_9BACT|nr:MAG: hypothetical protein OMM_06786 [Candidatus Magnetoglobus multicellularis str. Araruama]
MNDMKKSQKIIATLLIGALLITCLPFGNMDDISQDGHVDLEDVILVVKGVARTAETNQSLRVRVGKALSVINVAAGLKKVIKKTKDQSNISSSNDNLFLISTYSYGLPINNVKTISFASDDFHSVYILPELPPPRLLI